MENPDSQPVLVTGEQRAHPAIRILARACIALAQERLAEQKQAAGEAAEGASKSETAPEAERKKEATDAPPGAVSVVGTRSAPERAGKAVAKKPTRKAVKKAPHQPKPSADVHQEGDRHA